MVGVRCGGGEARKFETMKTCDKTNLLTRPPTHEFAQSFVSLLESTLNLPNNKSTHKLTRELSLDF